MTGYAFLLVAGVLTLFANPAAATPDTEAGAATETQPISASERSVVGSGIVEGTVKYRPDPKRPWKFSRYYVHNSNEGALAEAVVVLEGLEVATSSKSSDAPKVFTMDQVNFQFVPEIMAIRAGDSVRVINSDDSLHNVMTMDGGKPFNNSVAKGTEFQHTFERAGGLEAPIHLSCAFHGGMRAWIYVFDHPWFGVTGTNGQFRLENVPAGGFTLRIHHPAGKLRWNQRVEVKPGRSTAVEIVLSPDSLIDAEEKNH